LSGSQSGEKAGEITENGWKKHGKRTGKGRENPRKCLNFEKNAIFNSLLNGLYKV